MLDIKSYLLLHYFVWTLALGKFFTPTGGQTTVTALANHSDKQAFMQAIRYKKDYRRLKKQEGAIKLVGGERGAFEGNVEILHKGRWGNVCDDEWDELEARVVCGQLGYKASKAWPTGNSYFGHSRRRYWMDNVLCDGTESELAKCRFDGWGKTDCEGGEAAGVICDHFGEDVEMHDNRVTANISNLIKLEQRKSKIRDVHQQGIAVRLTGFRQGRIEIKLGDSDWGVVCGDGWSLLEASVICRQLGLGYAAKVYQTNFFGDNRLPMAISGIKCHGNEKNIAECVHDTVLDCPGVGENVAGVTCTSRIADLVLDSIELQRTAHLEDRQLFWLQCAMEENCVSSQAYQVQRESQQWYLESRRLLRFTARILNAGTADFRPSVPKHLWEWHMCHMHYHSMEVFATFDIIDSSGKKVAEGHKASFCLEDNQCLPGIKPRYKCAGYGDQGISVNCSDIYKYNIDCQWIDISELNPGLYTFKVAVNPELKVGEMSFDNNAATCKLLYTDTFAKVHSCVMGQP
ncbi:PREDICTED: lysyl oxidase homolog 2 [Ceratosolen solmsi marchali]|uniref:protein-lysine 6-oxidase n=1 Tax=Ceratosolen solmsi marchali TaxID=326594 RepID=A0AAJ7DWN9_9HYME|nr:PREDICTED: lysyl oxidase homolog 2 [Ceratosolen solmsi marchali]